METETRERGKTEDKRKARKGTIKVTLHLTAASVLGRDETAVFIGGETDEQRKRKKKEEKRSKERRKCEKKGKIAGLRKKGTEKGRNSL